MIRCHILVRSDPTIQAQKLENAKIPATHTWSYLPFFRHLHWSCSRWVTVSCPHLLPFDLTRGPVSQHVDNRKNSRVKETRTMKRRDKQYGKDLKKKELEERFSADRQGPLIPTSLASCARIADSMPLCLVSCKHNMSKKRNISIGQGNQSDDLHVLHVLSRH